MKNYGQAVALAVLALVGALAAPVARAASEDAIELAPIIKEGTPADVLMEDPVRPTRGGPSTLGAGEGTVLRGIADELPLPVTDLGHPGTLSQLRGIGRSAEDTNVQTLGIPLNYPQGGGFDLSAFPQFLWSSYRFQEGPSLGAFDPRAVAGTLTLTPWTQAALATPARPARASALVSDPGLQQYAVAASTGPVALVAGLSGGDAFGPSGGASARWELPGVEGAFHLLATSVDAASPGSLSFPTPNARQKTIRAIPVAQADVHLPDRALLKASAFYDFSQIHYNDPDSGFFTNDFAQQAGVETALLAGAWKLGASGRYVTYRKIDFTAPDEAISALSASRTFESGEWLFEPGARVVLVSRFDPEPEASIGVRHEDGTERATFLRLTTSARIPSLADRYYSIPGFSGNPGLTPERDWTGILGEEFHTGGPLSGGFQLYGQLSENAQVSTPNTVLNEGTAEIVALQANARYELTSWLTFTDAFALTGSQISATGGAFPYLPAVSNSLGATVHGRRWDAHAWLRLAGSATVQPGEEVAGYGYLDLDASARVWNGVSVSARVENVFDSPIQLVKDYPLPRTGGVLIVGEF
jgi:hypothetical protein